MSTDNCQFISTIDNLKSQDLDNKNNTTTLPFILKAADNNSASTNTIHLSEKKVAPPPPPSHLKEKNDLVLHNNSSIKKNKPTSINTYKPQLSSSTLLTDSSTDSFSLPLTPPILPQHNYKDNKNKDPHFILDADYLPESNLQVAMMTMPALHPNTTKPNHPSFPPATLENLSQFRKAVDDAPDDQLLQLNFAKYLIEASEQIQMNDKERHEKTKEAMLLESQRLIKQLSTQTKLGKPGLPDAQFYLANAYGTGSILLKVNHEKAFNLYLQGSKQSHPECTYRAGVCYELGLGTHKNNAQATQFYRKAANLGNVSAMYKMSTILLKGLLNQSRHPKEAISWLKRAVPMADAYHPEVLHELGLAYEHDGIPSVIPDKDYARELITKAARFGYAPSQYKLGLAYENASLNCPMDARRSIAWYGKAAEQGHLESALALSGWYLTGAPGVLLQNDKEAFLWAQRTAEHGYAKGQYACGYYSETGIGVNKDLNRAIQWYQLAAQQNYQKAIIRLKELNVKYKKSNNNNKRSSSSSSFLPLPPKDQSQSKTTKDLSNKNKSQPLENKSKSNSNKPGCLIM
ncbi:unnamed protein product [Cunninghamella blakesleeana]